MSVDAATGGRSVFGRAIEKVTLGVPQGQFEFINFDEVDISRLDEEQESKAITGNDGMDRGTPSDIKTGEKLKYSMTASRVLFDLVAMFGKPVSVQSEASVASVTVSSGGTGYDPATTLSATGGGGQGFKAHVTVDGSGVILTVVVDNPGFGYTSAPTIVFDPGALGTGAALLAVLGAASSWFVKIRPSRLNELRAASLYLYEGGSYSATLQMGRRVPLIQFTDAANRRVECDITYAAPTGDTIAGFAVAKVPNAGTFAGTISSRGRRPFDTNFTSGKSLYVKVGAMSADDLTLSAKYGAASPGDGTGFDAGPYDAATFVVPKATVSVEGYGIVSKDEGTVGLFGENFEPFELTFGPDLTGLTVGDEFEIPAVCAPLTKTVVAESRLSAFHLVRTIDGTADIRIDKGYCKIERPYKPYIASGKRLPQAIDPEGDVKGEWQFSKRLFNRFFRAISEAHARFTIHDKYQIENAPESVEIFAAQCAVTTAKSGDIKSKNVLEETITLVSEQPDTVVTPPAGFDGTFPIEINVRTKIDPTWLD